MEAAVKMVHLGKQYRLGQINTGSLVRDVESWFARLRGKADPNAVVGAEWDYNKKGSFWALKDVNIEIGKGERVGIIGHNGAGKSTLLKLLSQVTAPTQGEIYMNGRVACMLEVGAGFHAEMTGRENIYMNGAILGMTRKEIDDVMEDIIAFSECEQFIDTPVKRYSSGMYVKLAFSVAAHLDSDIVIMDEVLAVGDYQFQKKCMNRMYHMAVDEGRTVLCVSHNMENIRTLCSRCIVLDHGQVVFDGDVEKGISIYQNRPAEQEAKKFHHITMKTKDGEKRFEELAVSLETLEFLDAPELKYRQGSSVRFRVGWQCSEEGSRFRLRLRLRTAEGLPVGASETGSFMSGPAKKTVYTVFSMPTAGLAPAKYFLMLDILSDGEQSEQAQVINEANEALSFQIVSYWGAPEWINSEWGNLQMKKTRVE